MTTPNSNITDATSNGSPPQTGSGAQYTQEHAWKADASYDGVHGPDQGPDDPLGLQFFLAELEGGIKSLFQQELNEHARDICRDVAQMQYEVNKANEAANAEHEKVLGELKRLAHLTHMFTQHVSPILGVSEG